ncbi:hypothetical protein HY404_00090 [Candidatus Microgenomates bacterium]|nr:hypothetical protein [Candidatus Microgenomates bacterium]
MAILLGKIWVAYLAVLVVLGVVINFIWGEDATEKVVVNFLAWPFLVPFRIIGSIWYLLTWPWRYRARRLFSEVFEFWPWSKYDDRRDFHVATRLNHQALVDVVLEKLAKQMDGVFSEQTEYRIRYPSDSNMHISLQTRVDRIKNNFWLAHSMAKRHGFEVRDKYTDYLPIEPPPVRQEREVHQLVPTRRRSTGSGW